MSNAGFAFGYFSGLTGLVCAVPFILFLTHTQNSLEEETSVVGYKVGRYKGLAMCHCADVR